MQNKRALITGGSSGIGRQTAIGLAKQGWEIIIASRDVSKGTAAAREIEQLTGNQQVSFRQLDLGSLNSVRVFARDFLASYSTLELLINNAGVMPMKRETTADGFEKNMGTNHLGHFLLTLLLLPALKSAATARIVVVASDAHARAKLDFDDLQCTKGYQWMTAYANSKLANLCFALTLARKLEESSIQVHALHPGMTKTNIWPRHTWYYSLFSNFVGRFAIPDTEGAKNVLRIALDPELKNVSGKYFDREKETAPSILAQGQNTQERLWKWSESATGQTF